MADASIPLVKYQHIENLKNKLWSLRPYLSKHGLEEAEWVASEKLDGANLQFCTDGVSVVCASRSRILTPDANFHNYQKLLAQYRDVVLKAYQKIKAGLAKEEFTVVRFYGEIFGGLYPSRLNKQKKQKTKDGPEEERSEEQVARPMDADTSTYPKVTCDIAMPSDPVMVNREVQGRVFYAPHVDFYLFDVSYEPEPERHLYLDVDEVVKLARDSGFRHVADPLHRGTLEEMLELNPAFPTTISQRLGLPDLEGNLAEGYVLRLAKNPTYNRSTDDKLQTACIKYKLKQPNFEETAGGAVVERIKVKVAKENSKAKPKVMLDDKEQELLVHLLSGFTENRILSILSKMHEIEKKALNPYKLGAMLIDDVLEELSQDRDDLAELMQECFLDKDKLRKVKSVAFPEVSDFVKEYKINNPNKF